MTAQQAFRICTILWLAWIVIWMLWAFRSKQTKERESILSRIGYAIPAWTATCLMFSPRTFASLGRAELFPPSATVSIISIGFTALGFALTLWARYVLGSNWSGTVTIKVGHELIRTGPYRWVRHPIYTGLIISGVGTALALDQWRGIAAILLLWLSFTIKRLKEEQFMRQTFGEQYIDYSRTTGAIFPALIHRSS